MDSPESSRTLQFQFNGKAGEYFKIWIVNVALTIITIGIYSPWAKVRSKRYFYGNTILDGSSFDYLADPLAILKGRMLVFAVLLVYVVSTEYIHILKIIFLILYIVALPWIVVKSMQFNTRNSAYRNIRFNFDGALGEAARVYIGLFLLSMITLGLAIPYSVKRSKQFTVEHSYFGTSKFDFHATGGSFYMIYLKALAAPFIIAIILGIISAIAIPAYQGYINAAKHHSAQQIQAPQQQTQSTNHQPLPQSTNASRTGTPCNPATPASKCQQTQPGKHKPVPKAVIGIMVVSYVLVLAFYLLIAVYIRTRTDNLVLNNTSLEKHKLQSTLRVRGMFYIYFTNIIAILISVGLLIPWAKIRTAKYRFDHTALIAQGDLRGFVADEQEAVTAAGVEFTSALDIDLGF